MREALRFLCLSWVCLVAAARVAAPMVVAREAADVVEGSEGFVSSEVFDFSTKSSLSGLPITLTVRPLAAGWWLDITLRLTETSEVCVRLEDKLARLKVAVSLRSCDEGVMTDSSFMNVSVPSANWTNLGVDVKGDAVIVSMMNGTNTSVVTHGPPLQRFGTQVELTRTENVEVAVWGRTTCPGYRYVSPGIDKKKNVKTWTAERGKFYFLPGNTFVRLEYEVGCTTTLGPEQFQIIPNITVDSQKPQWHVVLLEHNSGLVTVSLDYWPLKNKTLPGGCTFSKQTIRVMGDGLFSFMCNPFNGEAEDTKGKDSCMLQAGKNTFLIWIVIVIAILVVILLGLVSYIGIQQRKLHQKLDKQQQDTNNNNNNNKQK